MTAPEELRRWTVRGLVQGVGFRVFVAREANRLRLRGTVRNTRDGSVDVVAAGPADALDRLEEHLRQGPEASRVESLEPGSVEEIEADLPRTFRIVS